MSNFLPSLIHSKRSVQASSSPGSVPPPHSWPLGSMVSTANHITHCGCSLRGGVSIVLASSQVSLEDPHWLQGATHWSTPTSELPVLGLERVGRLSRPRPVSQEAA